MAYFEEREDKKVFIELDDQPDVYRSKDGFTLKKVGEDWAMFDPDSAEISDRAEYCSDYSFAGLPFMFVAISYEMKHGRPRWCPVRWSPAHFTKGTVVELETDRGQTYTKIDQPIYTVDEVVEVEPGNFALVFMETEPGRRTEGERAIYNTAFVKRIISRPPGKAVIRNNYQPSEDRIAALAANGADGNWMREQDFYCLAAEVIDGKPEHFGVARVIDELKLLDRMRQMGLAWRGANYQRYWIKFKPALKYLRKNPHWLLATIKESREARYGRLGSRL